VSTDVFVPMVTWVGVVGLSIGVRSQADSDHAECTVRIAILADHVCDVIIMFYMALSLSEHLVFSVVILMTFVQYCS